MCAAHHAERTAHTGTKAAHITRGYCSELLLLSAVPFMVFPLAFTLCEIFNIKRELNLSTEHIMAHDRTTADSRTFL